jgi:hypothetical protein
VFTLTLAVLVVAAVTLIALLARPAALWVERQDELGLDDLIFFGGERPTEFLLQLHVAAANVGGRKGVLSALYLDVFADARGHEVRPYQLPMPLQAQLARQLMRRALGPPARRTATWSWRPAAPL